MRLQRYLAQAGVASRRRAETLITAGRVRVNGQVVTELGTRVDPEKDRVEFDDQAVTPRAAPEVWMLHKPTGVVTTMSDPQGRRTVADLVQMPGRRLVPVGRLDIATSGLLLMSDDGDLALRLTHPRWAVEKVYLTTVEGAPSPESRAALLREIDLDGRPAALAHLEPAADVGSPRRGQSRWRATVHEGRYHLVRRLFEAVGHPVVGLHRIRIGPLTLGPLKRGEARRLTDKEIAALRRAVGLDHAKEEATAESDHPAA